MIDIDLITHLDMRGDFQDLEAGEKRWRKLKLVYGQRWKNVKKLCPTEPIGTLMERPSIHLTTLVQSLPTVELLTDIIRAELQGVFQGYIDEIYTVLDSYLSARRDEPCEPVVILPSQDPNPQLAYKLILPTIDQHHSHRRRIRVPED
jgi:hypothetical protein